MTSFHSYGKIYGMGHAAIKDLLLDSVIVEEKLDGSLFQIGIIQGELRCRSKGAELNLVAPEKMFTKAIETAQSLASQLHPEWTYYGEFVSKNKHNTLCYDRTPNKYWVIFDIAKGEQDYLPYEEKLQEATRLGLECVPKLYEGKIENVEMFRALLETVSMLGGQKVEGLVIKNYARFGVDGKCLMGKYVSEAFKEIHGADWKERNPKSGDIIQQLIEQFRTPARWNKAIQHLTEQGKLEHSPKDIGILIQETKQDIEKECEEEIKQLLFVWAKDKIMRGVTAGLPQFYKDLLMQLQFSKEEKV